MFLDYDKASEAYQLRLTLSAEAETEEDSVELPPKSPRRVNKQPCVDIESRDYDDRKTAKQKVKAKREPGLRGKAAGHKIKIVYHLPAQWKQNTNHRQEPKLPPTKVKMKYETFVKREEEASGALEDPFNDDDVPTLDQLMNYCVIINDVNSLPAGAER